MKDYRYVKPVRNSKQAYILDFTWFLSIKVPYSVCNTFLPFQKFCKFLAFSLKFQKKNSQSPELEIQNNVLQQ